MSCGSEDNSNTKVVAKTPQDINKITAEQLKKLFETNVKDTLLVLSKDTLVAYPFFRVNYKDAMKTLFTDKGVWNSLGDSLFRIIKDARYYGLIPNDYHYSTIDSLYKSVYNKAEENYDATALAKIDLLLADGYYKMGAHLNKGRFYPDSLMLEWKPAKLDTNWHTILTAGLKATGAGLREALDALEPKHEGYQFLKKELRKFITEYEKTDWDSVSFNTAGDTTVFLANLKKRLLATGDYDTSGTDSDSLKMAKAIKSYQTKMNLDPDGKLGKLTKQALHLSKETTIRQMEMSLERWRWEVKKFPNKFFWVNIPAADLHIWEMNTGKIDRKVHKTKKAREKVMQTVGQDTLVLYSRIVVGKPETPTPVLTSKISYMLIYPYWTVPYSIAWKEILPAVQRDTAYLRKKNFEVINSNGEVMDASTIKWKKYNKTNLPFKFRQRIGDDNSLGVVKFNFNNKHGVYLHDTNSKRYFKTFYRYQSHGCMRLEKYWETAKFLMREDTTDTPYDTLARYFATPEQRQINIKKTIPIFVRYYTTIADSTGLHHYIDIYRRDEKMADLLYKRK
jgi:murein L,D-transpeptidase YcbB/YkuD